MTIQDEASAPKKPKVVEQKNSTPKITKTSAQAHCLGLQADVLELEREKINLEMKFYAKGLNVFERLEKFLEKQ